MDILYISLNVFEGPQEPVSLRCCYFCFNYNRGRIYNPRWCSVCSFYGTCGVCRLYISNYNLQPVVVCTISLWKRLLVGEVSQSLSTCQYQGGELWKSRPTCQYPAVGRCGSTDRPVCIVQWGVLAISTDLTVFCSGQVWQQGRRNPGGSRGGKRHPNFVRF